MLACLAEHSQSKLLIIQGFMYRAHESEKKILLKMAKLFKAIYRFKAISIKIPMAFFFHRTRTNNPKICMEPQKTSNSQSKLEKEKQNWMYSRLPVILQRCIKYGSTQK